MADTRYKKGGFYSADMEAYLRMMSGDNRRQMEALQAKLTLALREDVTPRQRQMLFLYYEEGLTMRQIAEALHLDPSTVSRTIKRGRTRLHRCLRYSDDRLLGQQG